VQVDPIKPELKAPGTKRLKLKSDEPLSSFGFKFKLRRYMKDPEMRLLYDAELAQQRVGPSLFAHNVPVYPGPEASNRFTLVVT
jgi:hypothetical protein